MTIQAREQQALDIYLKLLKSKGFGPDTFIPRVNFLNQLMPLLADLPLVGGSYRTVLENFMDSVAEKDWPESLIIAREYYPFWINDLKAVSNLSQSVTQDTLPIDWKPAQTELVTLWHAVDQEKFGTADNWALKAYAKGLRNENAEQTLIDTRMKLAKVLLMRLKDAPDRDNKAYRITVDATLPLFEVKKNRRLFLVVVREFYHFWSGNPEAEKYLFNHNAESFL